MFDINYRVGQGLSIFIERMENYIKIGNAIIPQHRIRARLQNLDYLVLQSSEHKIRSNAPQRIKNSVAYVMTVVYNCITEYDCDVMTDSELNAG